MQGRGEVWHRETEAIRMQSKSPRIDQRSKGSETVGVKAKTRVFMETELCFSKMFFGKMVGMTVGVGRGSGRGWVRPLFKPSPAAGWRVTSEAAPHGQYNPHLSPR